MACRLPNPLELNNALKNKEHIYDVPEIGTEQESILAYADNSTALTGVKEVGDDKSVYTVSGVNDAQLGRLTSYVKQKLKQGSDYEGSSEPAIAGTFLHSVMQYLMVKIHRGLTAAETQEFKSLVNAFPYEVGEGIYTNLQEYGEYLYNKIQEFQNQIDPEGKFDIRVETRAIDPVRGIGGTTDLLVVFSDGSAGKIDYKFFNPQKEQQFADPTNKILRSQNAAIYSKNLQYYKEQALTLRHIYQKHYHIKTFRFDWVLPIQMDLQTKKFVDKKPVNLDKPQLKSVKTDLFYKNLGNSAESVSVKYALSPISIGKTSVSNVDLDAYILKQREFLERLRKKMSNPLITDEQRTYFRRRYTDIENNINALTFEGDLSFMLQNVLNLETRFLELQELFNNHKTNPDALEMFNEQLVQIKQEVDLFSDLDEAVASYIAELRKEEDTQNLGEDAVRRSDVMTNIANQINNVALRVGQAVDYISYQTVKDFLIDDYYKDDVTGEIRPFKQATMMNSMLETARNFNNPFIVSLKKHYDTDVLYNVNKNLQREEKTIVELNKQLKEAGLTAEDLKNYLINPDTKNLHGKVSKEFSEKLDKALKQNSDSNFDFLRKLYVEKDSYKFKGQTYNSYDEYFEARLENQRQFINNLSTTEKQKKYELDSWIKNNRLFVDGKVQRQALFFLGAHNGISYSARLSDKAIEDNESEGYRKIKSVKAVKDWYEYITTKTRELHSIIGYDNSVGVPSTFYPWVRKTTVERFKDHGFFGGIKSNAANFVEGLSVRQDDIHRGVTDDTGIGKDVPLFFTKPFKTEDGEIDDSERSYDFGYSMFAFAQMMYNYQYTKMFETKALLLRQVMLNQKYKFIQPNNTKGEPQLNIFDEVAQLPVTLDSFDAKAFDVFMDKYIYGISVREKGRDFKILGSEMNSTKALLAAKEYSTKAQLGFGFIGPMAGAVNARLNLSFQANKSIYFAKEHLATAEQTFVGTKGKDAREKFLAAVEFFLPRTETVSERGQFKTSSLTFKQRVNERMLFAGYRLGSDYIDDVLLNAMLQNYGWDSTTKKLVRLNKPGVKDGLKPLSEIISVKENGLEFEGVETDSREYAMLQSEFRAAVKSVSQGIKGEMSDEDVAFYQQFLLGKLLSQYRTWMPGMLKERFGTLKYNINTDSLHWGRWNSAISDFHKDDASTMAQYLSKVALPRISKLILDIGTFGYLAKPSESNKKIGLGIIRRYDDSFLQNQYERILKRRPDIKMSFEEFKELKYGQYRAMLTELRVIIGLALLVMAAASIPGDDDEDKALYTESKFGRIAFKILSKLSQEMRFGIDPTESGYLFKNPIPMLGMFITAKRALENFVDELTDDVYGEDSKKDQTPYGYYSLRFVMGWNQMRHFIEWFDLDKSVAGYKN